MGIDLCPALSRSTEVLCWGDFDAIGSFMVFDFGEYVVFMVFISSYL